MLTVAQDGSGQYRTIQAALDALKPGQVVKVLDRGPYREYLRPDRGIPADCGLVSDQQTVLAFPDGPPDWRPKPESASVQAHIFKLTAGFRLHGFALTFPERNDGQGLVVDNPRGFVLEDCLLRMPPGDSTPHTRAVQLYASPRPPSQPAVIRECVFQGRLGTWSDAKTQDFDVLVARNYFAGSDKRVAVLMDSTHRKVVIRHNVFGEPPTDADTSGVGLWSSRDCQAVEVSNNTFTGQARVVFGVSVPRGGVWLCNNLFANGNGAYVLPPGTAPEATRQWEVGHSVFAERWQNPNFATVYPAATDRVTPVSFLSLRSTDPDYLRLPADGPLAAAGAGGAWPGYVGALPPGPAPREGDWFARLRQRWPLPAHRDP